MTAKMWAAVIKAVAVTAMVVAIVWLSVSLHRKGKDLRRVRENYGAEVTGDRSRQQTIDVRDLKEYFSREVAALKEQGIPARNVEHIVEIEYRWRDTTRWRDTLIYIYDTIRDARRADFCVSAGCYDIDGQIVGDTLEIASVTAYDEIIIALYREKRKCLFEKQRVRAVAISSCTGDTLSIKRNIRIER
jgi:hypothetical protein